MRNMVRIALVAAALALAGGNAALASPPPGHGHSQKAPGQVCKGKSKKHVKGEKGTAFSRCVKEVNEQRQKEREEGSAS